MATITLSNKQQDFAEVTLATCIRRSASLVRTYTEEAGATSQDVATYRRDCRELLDLLRALNPTRAEKMSAEIAMVLA